MKTVVITGASTGIGFAATLAFANEGYQVFAGVRKQSDGERLVKENGAIIPLIVDVTDPLTISKSVDVVSQSKKFSELVLINNAGIAVSGPIETVSMSEFRKQMEVNYFGLIAMTQAYLPQIRQSKGRVINISSIAGRLASPFLGPYSSSKFAVEAISDSLRREMLPFEVKVVVIEPGPIQTPIWEKGLGKKDSIIRAMTPAQIGIYGKYIQPFEKMVEVAMHSAEPVDRVVEALREAITSSNPSHRYLVGKEARVNGFLAAILPSKWVDYFVAKKVAKA